MDRLESQIPHEAVAFNQVPGYPLPKHAGRSLVVSGTRHNILLIRRRPFVCWMVMRVFECSLLHSERKSMPKQSRIPRATFQWER